MHQAAARYWNQIAESHVIADSDRTTMGPTLAPVSYQDAG